MPTYQIIKIPFHLGAPKAGTDKGPDRIINYLKNHSAAITNKIITVKIPKGNPAHRQGKYAKIKSLPEVKEMYKQVKKTVYQVAQSNKIPLILHGDDSVVAPEAWGILKAAKQKFGIIYMDTHPDANTPKTTISGCFFGMGVAHMLGFGNQELIAIKPKGIKLKGANIVMIGQRDFDPGEKGFIKKNEINLFECKDIKKGLTASLKRIRTILVKNKIRKIYLHIDQDVIDPKESGASLTTVANGLNQKEFFTIIKFLVTNFELAGISLGNYLPAIDKQGKTLKIIIKLLKTIKAI